MFNYRRTSAILAACTVLFFALETQAYSSIQNAWHSHYSPCQDLVDLDCNACHTGGFGYNAYGTDLKYQMDDLNLPAVDAFLAVEGMDSDGDGYSNGQEIVVDCTNPADTDNHGTVAQDDRTWDRIKALFR